MIIKTSNLPQVLLLMSVTLALLCKTRFHLMGTARAETSVLALPSTGSPIAQRKTDSVEQQEGRYSFSLGNENNGVMRLKKLHEYIIAYRSKRNGLYPSQVNDILPVLAEQGRQKFQEAMSNLYNPDSQYSDDQFTRQHAANYMPYYVSNKRPDGSLIGAARQPGTKDVLAYTEVYYRMNRGQSGGVPTTNPAGNYLVLWDDSQIEKVPYDEVIYTPVLQGLVVTFPNQSGISGESMSYTDYWTYIAGFRSPPIGKPVPAGKNIPVKDNGGPESLITLSRLIVAPAVTEPYLHVGIEREKMWQMFDATRSEFTLADVAQGAAKLALPLQKKKLSLDELQKLNISTIFLTNDDKRIVTLANIDDKQAIVLDQGMTRIISREVLAKRYGGEALLPAAATTASQVLIDDPIRVLAFKSRDEEVKQQVKITNNGKTPLTLQIERPIPGVTQADLSSDTVAPGASATLSLSIKWRSVLKGDRQNVFVFLRTNDPVRPRIQLGFQLNAPKAGTAPTQPATTQPPTVASPAP